ncbi:MAG TPA: hypothetical protein VFG20_11350 [Planctomycetaceae bacterium]|jgi:hypothetical protein|nr:hypothetical protein [Planctomycetaceae bacterium]
MLQPVFTVCAVITLGSLITIGVVSATKNSPMDARGNPLVHLDPREVDEAANEPCASPHLVTSL